MTLSILLVVCNHNKNVITVVKTVINFQTIDFQFKKQSGIYGHNILPKASVFLYNIVYHERDTDECIRQCKCTMHPIIEIIISILWFLGNRCEYKVKKLYKLSQLMLLFFVVVLKLFVVVVDFCVVVFCCCCFLGGRNLIMELIKRINFKCLGRKIC
jgi:hypothetical protein